MNVNETVKSADGTLEVQLEAFDRITGKGRVRVRELPQFAGRFFITLTFASGSAFLIDYRKGDTGRAGPFEISTSVRGDEVASLKIEKVGA